MEPEVEAVYNEKLGVMPFTFPAYELETKCGFPRGQLKNPNRLITRLVKTTMCNICNKLKAVGLDRPKETNDAGERSYRGNCVASCCRCQFRGLNAQMRPKSREELVRQALDIVLNHLPQLLDALYPLLAGQDALQARALVLKSQLEAQELVYEAQRVEAVKQSRAAHELAMAVEEAQQAQELKESRAAHKQAMADLRAEQQQARAAHVQAKMCIEATYAREIGHLNAARANTLSEHLYALSRTAASCQVAAERAQTTAKRRR